MNLPNKLTILRICLVPLVVLFLLGDFIPFHTFWALVAFGAAAITDAIDGHFARKHNLITDFGKFLDPLADKILVISALICFVEMDVCSSVIVVIVIAREFLVSALRLVAVGEGKVIAASGWGKAKTISQMVAIVFELVFLAAVSIVGADTLGVIYTAGQLIGSVLLWVSTVLTLVSGADYLIQNRAFLNPSK